MNLGIVSLVVCSVGIAVLLFVLAGVMSDLLPQVVEKTPDPKAPRQRSTKQWMASLGTAVGSARSHTTVHLRLHR